ncbi:MAG: glycosyltransferase [Lachnospiraceae bacterium]|nr:glycosyltransferase [Lachnospiraceae bacterium]
MSGHAAFYIGSLQIGGAEHVMVNLAEALFARGWRITFVTTYIDEEEYEVPHGCWCLLREGEPADARRAVAALTPGEKRVRVAFSEEVCAEAAEPGKLPGVPGTGRHIGRVFSGVATADAGGRGSAFLKRRACLKRIWDDLQPDVILSFIGKNNLMALLTAGQRLPVLVSVRAVPELEYPGRMMRAAANALFGRAAAVVVQTPAAADFFPKRVREKAVVMPNAVSREFLTDERGTGDPEGSTRISRKRDKTVVAVGRMDANKRFDLLLRAFARLREEEGFKEYQLLLYGDGEDRPDLERLAQSLGIGEKTGFMGRRQGIAGLIRNAGAYCLVSDTEGMPNTLIEAMCLGIPCVTTDCVPGGIGQLVRDGENALVIPAGDEEALVAALRRVLRDETLAGHLSENAVKIRERYDPDRVTDAWEELLVKATEKR